MRPISDINIGDQYERGYPYNLFYSVIEIDKREKMVKIQGYDENANPVHNSFWLKNNNTLFNKRRYNSKTYKMDE